jgi:hypothetical protein
MISNHDFERLCAGRFVSLTLVAGPTVDGYAARDLDRVALIRVDGLALEDDDSISRFSLRLECSQIDTAVILSDAPAVTDLHGAIHRMRPSFWDTIE